MKAFNFSGASVVYFSRWTRKTYAIFNSLRRVINISHLHITLSLLSLTSVTAAVAQNTTDSLTTVSQDLEEIEISALEEPLAFSQLGRIITTISQQDIAAAPVHDLASLLSVVQGVDIRQRGSNGMQTDISMRGGTFDQVLVLLNGIPISDPQTGHFNLNLPIDVDIIDRIEVLQGPGASVFGANAYSGAINIICKAKANNQLLLKANGGSYNTYGYGSSVNISQKAWQLMATYKQDGSNGYMENTDFLGRNLFANTQWQKRKWRIEGTLAWQGKSFGANSFYSPKFPMQYETNQARIAALGVHWNDRIKISLVPYYRQHRDNWQLLRTNPSLYQNFHQTDIWGLRGKSYFYSAWGKSTIGIDAKQESLLSSSMGDALDTERAIPWQKSQTFKYGYKRQHLSIFSEQNLQLNQSWSAALSLMMHYYQADTAMLQWYPGLHSAYRLSPHWQLTASVSNAMRLPTFTDLFYTDQTNRGNKNLKPERSWTYEVGSTYDANPNWQGEFVAFWRQGRDIIDWAWNSQDSIRQATNIGALETYGIEISVSMHPQHNWNCKAWKLLSLNYTYIDQIKRHQHYEGKYAANYLKHRLNLQSQFVFFKHLHWHTKSSFHSRIGSYLTYDFANKCYGRAPYKNVLLLDSKIAWHMPKWEAYIQCNNITNQTIVEYGVLQPGISLQIGFKIRTTWQ